MSSDTLLATGAAVIALWLFLALRGRARSRPAVQGEHLAIDVIADGVVTFTDGRRRAALEVGSVNFAALGEARQRELVAGYAAVVDSLAHPVQILMRTVPHDLTPYLAGRERRAASEPNERLRRLSHERNAFVRRLAGSRIFLDRRFYLVVPADDPRPAARLWPGRSPMGDGRAGAADASALAAARQLAARCDELARQLTRCGLAARRLDDGELAELFYACWCPDLARVQRLRDDLREYTVVVSARRADDRVAGVGADGRRVP
jgi:hypothetical protein